MLICLGGVGSCGFERRRQLERLSAKGGNERRGDVVLAPELIPAATEAEHAEVEDGLGGLGQAADASDL